MSQTIPEITQAEHSRTRKAKRVVLVDPSDNGLLGTDEYPIPTRLAKSSTSTTTSVSDTNSSTTILASNTARKGATIANDSSAVLYLLLGAGTASTTNYTARLSQYDYFETPFNYTGQINGIWATDPNDGGARVTEFT